MTRWRDLPRHERIAGYILLAVIVLAQVFHDWLSQFDLPLIYYSIVGVVLLGAVILGIYRVISERMR